MEGILALHPSLEDLLDVKVDLLRWYLVQYVHTDIFQIFVEADMDVCLGRRRGCPDEPAFECNVLTEHQLCEMSEKEAEISTGSSSSGSRMSNHHTKNMWNLRGRFQVC